MIFFLVIFFFTVLHYRVGSLLALTLFINSSSKLDEIHVFRVLVFKMFLVYRKTYLGKTVNLRKIDFWQIKFYIFFQNLKINCRCLKLLPKVYNSNLLIDLSIIIFKTVLTFHGLIIININNFLLTFQILKSFLVFMPIQFFLLV